VDRGSWGRLWEFVVEPGKEPRSGPAHQNPAGPEPSLKDLHILARGCHRTWLPRVTVPTQNSIV
jgi:hypothetical protein